METLLTMVYVAGLILVANRVDQQMKRTQRVSYPYVTSEAPDAEPTDGDGLRSLMVFMLILLVGMLLFATTAIVLTATTEMLAENNPDIAERLAEVPPLGVGVGQAWLLFGFSILIGGVVMVLVRSRSLRLRIAAWIGERGTYDPDSSVHLIALVLALMGMAFTVVNLAAVGGIEGLAEEYASGGIRPLDALVNLVMMPALAFLGVGYVVRRSGPQAFQRLALRWPTRADIVWGVGVALGCFIMIVLISGVLSLLLPPEVLEQQNAAAQQIAEIFGGSLGLAFLAAISAAIGEEILFRGAIQPVFGLFPTTIFFALLHTQYALTPASAVIVLVGLAFGWLRDRQSTTSAIIAHFIYNFVQLAIVFLGSSVGA